MLDFQRFIKAFRVRKSFCDNPAMKHIYENIIWRDDVRINFVDVSNVRSPALSVCVKEIEEYCATQNSIDLQDRYVRQTIGCMVSAALEPFGYVPVNRTCIPIKANSQFFTSAQIYEYVGNETQRIERRIVNVADIEGSSENEKPQ